MPLVLHSGHAVAWSAWHGEPTVLAGAFFIAGLYVYGLLNAGQSTPLWRIAAFFAGWTVMLVSLISPLDAAADRLLSMHMLQHVGLTTIGPPLVLLGLTPAILRPVALSPTLLRLLRSLTIPAVTGTLFIVNMWLWHMPPVYEAALREAPVHVAMHIAFMATGLLFWWPVIQPSPWVETHGLAGGRISEGARLLYLFVTGFPMALLALLLLASPNVVYDFYDAEQPLWGIEPVEDQQIAGVIMGALGEAASFVAVTLLFFRYLDHDAGAGEAPPARPGPADAR